MMVGVQRHPATLNPVSWGGNSIRAEVVNFSRAPKTYTYDELGRVLTVTHPPNTGSTGNSGTTSYVYSANTVKITSPVTSRWKKYTMDGYGNLTRVDEPKPASGTYVTAYTYNDFN